MNKIAGSKLSEAREAKRYTQDEMAKILAERLGQPYSTRQYQKLEFGLFPKLKTVIIRTIDEILGSNIYGLVYEQKGRVLPIQKEGKPETKGKGLTDREILASLNRGFEAIAETMRSIENKMAQESTQAIIKGAVEKIAASLPGLLDKQEGGFGIVIELLKRDALREAEGNQEKANEILGEILNRIGPDLSPKMKESIRADGHR